MGGKTSKSTQAITIPPEVLARYNAINARADTVTNRPYQYYQGQFVAPLTATQQSGISNTNAAAGMAQPYFAQATDTLNNAQAATQPYFNTAGQAYGAGLGQGQEYLGAATGYAQQGGQAVNASDLNGDAIGKYLSPFLGTVLQGTAGILNQQNQQQQAGQMGNAIRSGAFGGDRGGIAAANLNQQQNLANAKIYSDILNQGYNTALETAVGQQAVGLGAAQANRTAQQQTADRIAALGKQGFDQFSTTGQNVQGLGKDVYNVGAATSAAQAALGTGAQDAALTGAAAQMTAGQVEQATEQAERTARYNEFLQAQSLPYQQLKLAGDIALGTGTASGSTTTTAQPGGFFSDERLKENIKAIGKTFDGQTIHSYNYKGDPRTQIGLIAQEVQKHHPEAVGLAGGYKTVDYDKATEDASDRGHMAYGGLASAGGSVMPQNAGQGFAGGGVAGFDPAVMQQILAMQQAMYEPISKGGMYAGGPNAGGGLVPQSEITARQLMVPAELARQATGAEQANSIANLGKTVGELGGEVGAWDWGGEEAKKKDKIPVPTTAAASAPEATGVVPPPPVDTTPPTPEELLKRRRRAMGGGIPYGGQGLDIPTSGLAAGSGNPMTASALQARQSGLDKLSKVANVADTGTKMAKFGKKIGLFSTGGAPYGGQGLDIPEEDESSKSYQLPTAGDMPDKPESGIDKIGKIAKIAGTVAAMFGSDKRMKENIKPIGKLFDGQIVHSYNYKGDPRTQIGLIAQEVEDHKPHAVGSVRGMKAVDYAKATASAAKRGHFAMGGEPEEAMEDVPSYEPTGLYSGDNKFIRNLFKSSASGNKNIDLMSGEELPAQMSEEAPKGVGFSKIPEPVGLAGAAKAGLPELLKIKKPMEFAKPAGLAPKMGELPTGIAQIARLIHAGEGTGKNPKSSALGPYQFVDSTFVGEFRKNYPDRAKGMSDSSIIALKRSPEGASISSQMGPKFIANNAKIVERAGFEPDAGNVYLAHFLGPDTAVKVLRADPNAPISRYVSEDAIKANPPLQKNPTVGGTINWARGYMQKQADYLNRRQRASGGLAGRNGYATDGRVEDRFGLPEDIDALSDAERLPTEEIIAAPETRKADGLAPPAAAMPVDVPTTPIAAPPVAEKPVGLGAAAPATIAPAAAAPKDNNIFRGKFFTGLKEGKATSIIPLLSGLSAMGTAPTRSLGVAAAAGIGAGAQAAQAQRAFGIKQGELKVAQQLADARTMEITKGILEGRYEFLENGMVRDTYTDTFLPTDLATIAKGKAFKEGPMEAITGKAEGAISRKDYLEKYPTAGTKIPDLPPSFSYEVDPKSPSKTIYALAEMTPGVRDARKLRDKAEYTMNALHKTLSDPGIGQNRLAQLTNAYNLSVGDYKRANDQWLTVLDNVAATPLKALEAGNAALINVNAEALGPLIADARTAIATKETIKQIKGEISEGGPLAPLQQNIGLRMQQVGFSPEFVKSLIGQDPSDLNVQNSLANQLTLNGIDPATLRDGAGTINARKAVQALLNNVEKRADGQIAAFDAANTAFKYNPLGADTPGTSINAQRGENNAKYLRDHPKPGTYEKGTVYYVGGKRFVVK